MPQYILLSNRRACAIIIVALAAVLLSSNFSSQAQVVAGSPDQSFGTNGVVCIDVTGSDDIAQTNALAIQPDGKIVLAGLDFIVRLNGDGSLDSSFGAAGKVFLSITAYDLALQPDGKIIVAGSTTRDAVNGDFALMRFDSNGNLDSSFGGGLVTTDFSGNSDRAHAIALQPDGKIVVAGLTFEGSSNRSRFALARYDQNGNLDATFGSGGKIITDFSGLNDQATGVVVQLDGKIIVVGTSFDGVKASAALARYDASGNLDQGFGKGGKVTTSIPGLYAIGIDVVLQPDGKIIVAGEITEPPVPRSDGLLARYNVDGSLDPGFGNGGTIILGGGEALFGIALQPDNKIVTGSLIRRFNTNGTFDTRFGNGGKAISVVGSAYAVAIGRDGKIVVAGLCGNSSNLDVFIARYNNDLPSYDLCLEDDDNGNRLQLNTKTGEYRFKSSTGVILTGRGKLKQKRYVITLNHSPESRQITVEIDRAFARARALVLLFSTGDRFTIADRNITDSNCGPE